MASLEITDATSGKWTFVGSAWQQDAEGIITAPAEASDQDLAFYTAEAYQDFEAEFDFRWDCVWTTAGFILRAQDARRYYVVDFPVVGQQYRGEHFWVTISRVDDRGYREGLVMKMVSGVHSHPEVWHKARVRIAGDEISVWVDGRPAATVCDSTYSGPGYVGLATYNAISGAKAKTSYRSLNVNGARAVAAPFSATPAPASQWHLAHPDHTMGCGRIIRAANGDLLAYAGNNRLVRSSDNARTWDEQPVPETHASGLLRSGPDGTVEMYKNTYPELPSTILKAVSSDNGVTWSGFREVGTIVLGDKFPYCNFGANTMLETRDGGLLICGVAAGGSEDTRADGRWNMRFAALDTFSIRSDDGGESWAEPVLMDGPPYNEAYIMTIKCGCETSVAQLSDGSLLSLNRPIVSPVMWETRSCDGGRTWTPMCRGSFPMYASCSSMICTASGAVLIGGRFPALAVQVSRDNGFTWQFHQIDTCAWANGAMFEIEPDVVLYMYGGREEFRYQVLRVTPTSIEPVQL